MKKGGYLIVLSMILIVLTVKSAAANGLRWATDKPEPEKQWAPRPGVLKNAYIISQMTDKPIANLKRAIDICNNYIKEYSNDTDRIVDAYVILAESYFNLGEFHNNDSKRLGYYEQGEKEADMLIKIAPDRWDGWFWWSANAGRISQLKGVLSSIFLFGSFKKHIFTAQKLAPNSPLVLDGLGVMYRQLPWIAGGDKHKSEAYLKKALAIDPHITIARLDLSITLLEMDKKAEAIKELNKIVNEKHPAWAAHYLKWDKPKAEALLKNITDYKALLDRWHMLM
ncbi:MAG: hypothetical protein M1381_11235 [Deltaproteobacteria bacterium]|nr:hypothetical protein [Deltaproteobacteria bacterium]